MTEQSLQKTRARSAQPFAAPGTGFFPGGGRKTHFEQLRHLSQWSRRVLVVTGPRGVGKSALYRQFSATLEPRAKAARVNAALVSSAGDVLHAIIQGFGIAAPADADDTLVGELVSAHAEEQDRAERFCIVMVDDAEVLETGALDLLMKLAAGAPLKVVLFGEVRLVPAVERAARARGVSWHEIRLGGFEPADVREYLSWRFHEQGHGDVLPFTDAQIKEIARLSEGLPGRVDQMANVLLARIRSAGEEARERRFPVLHSALLAVLLVAIAFAWLVWQPADDAQQTSSVEQLDVPPRMPAPAVEDEAPAPDSAPSTDSAPPAGAAPTSDAAPASDPAPSAGSATTLDSDTAVDQRPQPAAPPVRPEPGTRPDVTQARERDAAVQRPAPEAEPDAPAADAVDESRTAAWIMSQPASAYTLQLVIFSSAERAAEYLAEQANPRNFALFRQQRDGRIQHVVVYGSFASRAEAERAAAALPDGVGKLQPWIRTFEQVQAAARTALQQ